MRIRRRKALWNKAQRNDLPSPNLASPAGKWMGNSLQPSAVDGFSWLAGSKLPHHRITCGSLPHAGESVPFLRVPAGFLNPETALRHSIHGGRNGRYIPCQLIASRSVRNCRRFSTVQRPRLQPSSPNQAASRHLVQGSQAIHGLRIPWVSRCRVLLTTLLHGDRDPLRFSIDVCNRQRPERN